VSERTLYTADWVLPISSAPIRDGAVLVQAGRPQLLEQHLERWSLSAAELAMAPPPGQAALAPLIAEAIDSIPACSGAAGLKAVIQMEAQCFLPSELAQRAA
jgi:hypothetical protein